MINAALLVVTYELLESALHLPPGSRILRVTDGDKFGVCSLVVEHDSLPQVLTGAELVMATLVQNSPGDPLRFEVMA